MRLSFRPHHFLCTLAFQGEGYSPKFVQNYWTIVKILKANGDVLIEVTSGLDSICKLCPHHNYVKCNAEEKIQRLDKGHSQVLGISPGDVLTWAEAKVRIKEKMTLEEFHTACSGCQWKSLGICEKALKYHSNKQ